MTYFNTVYILLIFLFSAHTLVLQAQLSVDAANNSFYITFDTTVQGVNNDIFQGDGFSPSPVSGQIDSDAFRVTGLSQGSVPFGGTGTSGDFARGTATGDVSTGGIYGFQVESNNLTLGVNPRGGDFRQDTFTLLARNYNGIAIEPVQLS